MYSTLEPNFDASSTPKSPSETTPDSLAGFARFAVTNMATGDRASFDEIYHPDFSNREAITEPLAARGNGPSAAWATALWLRAAYADLVWDIRGVVADGDLAVTYGTMSGRHTGDFTLYAADGRVERVFPATGRRFEVQQAHFCRIRGGKVIEHWAIRDDLGQAGQLGWIPPSPPYLLACMIATHRARRRQR